MLYICDIERGIPKMKKFYLTLILIFALYVPGTVQAFDAAEYPMMEQLNEAGPSVVVCGNLVTVHHGEGFVLEIYNLAGLKVAAYKIDSSEQTIRTSLSRGFYILKLGKVVRKISIDF